MKILIGDRPEEECSDNEIISNCEDPVTLDSDDNEDVHSDTQASTLSQRVKMKMLENLVNPVTMEKINTNGLKIH